MKKRVLTLLIMGVCTLGIKAQIPEKMSYETVKNASNMRWTCPEINKYQDLLKSLQDDDFKIYANNVKENIQLVPGPQDPAKKFLVTQAILTIEQPLYSTDNLLNYISTWLKRNTSYGKELEIDKKDKSISSSASVLVAVHSSFFDTFKVSIASSLVIKIIETDKLLISFVVYNYKNDEYSQSDHRHRNTYIEKISDVYPFNPKSTHKNTYAKAYVKTYQYFWNFISDLCKDLNNNFSKDTKMLAQLHYEHSLDSLKAIYGEPTKVISDKTIIPDINKELRFYENAQKVVLMGKTIDFNDILNCEIVDDPTFIPGKTTTVGTGLIFFGFGLGGSETHRTADKTIHNYVVDIRIDNLATPVIRIATGQNEHKATEIASAFEYILRHQKDNNAKEAIKTRKITKRR